MNNIVILMGKIFKDIELRTTKTGKSISEVNLAIYNGKDDTTFIKVLCYGSMAETISKYCSKGDIIGFQAIIKNNNWTDKDGNKHYDYSFIANKLSFIPNKTNNNVMKKQEENIALENEPSTMHDAYAEFATEIDDSQLPF